MMHKLAFGTPGSEEQKRSQVALWAIYLPHAVLNRISSWALLSQTAGWVWASHTFFIQQQCLSLASSPKAPREKIPVPPNGISTPLILFNIHLISSPKITFPDDRCTGTCILGEQTAYSTHTNSTFKPRTFLPADTQPNLKPWRKKQVTWRVNQREREVLI